MPMLFRYLLCEYAKTFMMCFSGVITIYLVIDFFEKYAVSCATRMNQFHLRPDCENYFRGVPAG